MTIQRIRSCFGVLRLLLFVFALQMGGLVQFPAVSAASNFEHYKLNSPTLVSLFQKYLAYHEGPRTFKVFVMSMRDAASYRSRMTYESALGEALTSCASLTGLSGCQVFAVGNTIVWDMSRDEQEIIIAEYKASKMTPSIVTKAPLHRRALAGFQEYERATVGPLFKVFVLADDGSWSYRIRPTYEDALRDSMEGCEKYASRRGLCRTFAVGNTIVWDMSESERDAVIDAYRNTNSNRPSAS